MDVKALISIAVQGSLVLVVFSIGLQAKWSDLPYVFGKPKLLARGIFVVNVLVPVTAVLMCLVLPIAMPTKGGIILMALSPMCPLALGKMFKSAQEKFAVGMYVGLLLAAVLIVPASAALLSMLFGHDVSVPVKAINRLVLSSVLLPLILGITVASLWSGLSTGVPTILTRVAYLVLLPIVLLFLYRSGGAILSLIGDGTLIAIVVTLATGLLGGHLLGGPEPEHRIALAEAAATRHPGIAALIVHRHFDNPRVMLAVVLFLLTSVLASAVYVRWAKKRLGLGSEPDQAAPRPAKS